MLVLVLLDQGQTLLFTIDLISGVYHYNAA